MTPRPANHIVTYADLESLAGQHLGYSDWITIDQKRINLFAEATGDFQWIHVDVPRATEELGAPIAHGFLTLSIIPMLSQQLLDVTDMGRAINYGCNKVRFTQAVPVDSKVRLGEVIQRVTPRAGGKQLFQEFSVEVEGQKRAACVVEMISLVFPKTEEKNAS